MNQMQVSDTGHQEDQVETIIYSIYQGIKIVCFYCR